MKTFYAATMMAVLGAAPAFAQDYNVTVTNNMPEGQVMAPLIVLDAVAAAPFLFNEDGSFTEDYLNTILEGDPRPLNGKIGDGVAGPVLGTSGPPGVLIAGGETASADMFIFGNTLRFYAKGDYTEGDTVISGVFDISTGGGTVLLNRYDIGHTEGTNEITLIDEGIVEVVITPN
ncbi:hypothetical protein [Flavimaricola marinus]|uniref:PEP-CTERM sorting domain-containing protein n=1 Tax=Flavimaricola marinus TaxID=1819565 RepID=A0A238LIH6_9RHOB|nr:hypothetical protein [Flavimaricola marinus]SMY09353.1 hypothetical protein LOM8899_03518 [Flavimaricola marinus]